MDVLSHRVWEEVRAKRNLSHAPWAVFRWWYAAPYAGFYVTANDPNATMKVMMDEARRIRTDLVATDELVGEKAVLRTRCEQAREASADEATLLADGQLYAGDWRFARLYCDAIAGVSAEQIRAAARKYMTAWQTVIVGNPSKLIEDRRSDHRRTVAQRGDAAGAPPLVLRHADEIHARIGADCGAWEVRPRGRPCLAGVSVGVHHVTVGIHERLSPSGRLRRRRIWLLR